MKAKHLVMPLLVLLAAIYGCSGSRGSATAPAGQHAWLAVAHGQVDVQGGRVLVTPLVDGVVRSIAVRPGDRVKAGEVLAQLDSRAARIAVAGAQAGVAQAQASLAEVRVQLQQAEQRAPRIAKAAKAGAASGDAAAQARAAAAALSAKQSAAEAALQAAHQQLALAKLRLDEATLRATSAGTIVARDIVLGQAVSAASGKPLFEILPDQPRIVRAQLDADAADSIHRGMHAEVVRDSGVGPVHSATVLWVGQVLQPATLAGDSLQRALANDVDCVLLLAPNTGAAAKRGEFRIGQRVLVKFPVGGESVQKE